MALQGFGEIAEKLRRSTVQVAGARRGMGSGIVVNPDGMIVTNAHVAAHGPLSVELWDGSSFPARLESRSTRRDLALLRIPATNLAAAPVGNSDQVRVGELVVAVGNPFGFVGAVSSGIVHAVGRHPGLGPTKWIQSDVQLAPGNSGGPLADMRGNVIGVNTMIAAGLGLAVPSNTVTRLLAGDFEQAPLGVVLQPASVRVNGSEQLGLAVLDVVQGSAAEYASLRRGDTLVGLEGRTLNSLDDLEQALEGKNERVLHLQFIRDNPNKIRTAALRLAPSGRLTAA